MLDAGGQLMVAKCKDGASILRPGIATGKAFGALGIGVGTREPARRGHARLGFTHALSDLPGGGAVPWPGGVLARDANRMLPGGVRDPRGPLGQGRGTLYRRDRDGRAGRGYGRFRLTPPSCARFGPRRPGRAVFCGPLDVARVHACLRASAVMVMCARAGRADGEWHS